MLKQKYMYESLLIIIEVTGIGIDHYILKASCKAYIDAHAKYISEYELKEGIRT